MAFQACPYQSCLIARHLYSHTETCALPVLDTGDKAMIKTQSLFAIAQSEMGILQSNLYRIITRNITKKVNQV